ncbi:glycosyltransferase family 2 protein [Paenibacillus brasilensis]|uniref:Glycosyltransferase involved in cell wall biosynthesis n=1 Tax=Paenibacillus brasilensis TaxID=128574 RepID=A0ABU0KTH5_9BACL|nr:glycosyltransferase [Paenibacillus brasilensis]MDQ0492733.1 glycosyltransferase involved in cell wall biosynthesis [Paenibacillus brasilensis]
MGKVSVVVRTKDRPLLLKRAIDSILSQTYTDWEIVLVNSGEDKDLIESIMHDFKSKSSNDIILLHINTNLHIDELINLGVSKSSGYYVTLLDDDDTWAPSFLEECILLLDENEGVDGAVTQTTIIEETLEGNKTRFIKSYVFNNRLRRIYGWKIARCNLFTTNSFVYKREAYDKIGGYRKDIPLLGDWEFNMRFYLKYKIGVIPKPLANYHKRIDVVNRGKGFYSNTSLTRHLIYDRIIRRKYLKQGLSKGPFLFCLLVYLFGYINSFIKLTKSVIYRK